MSRVLYVAWKVDPNTAFLASIQRNNENFFYGFSNVSNENRLISVFTRWAKIIGVLYFFINKALIFRVGFTGNFPATLVKRNRLNEWILRKIIRRFKIDRVEFHWVGYGFFPSASIATNDYAIPVTVFHHDWYHFTSNGEHVPRSTGVINSKLWSHGSIDNRKITHCFVSGYQQRLLKKLVTQPQRVEENKVRFAFTDVAASGAGGHLYRQRVNLCQRPVVLFVGVRPTTYDYKGLEATKLTLASLTESDIYSIGVGCHRQLSFDMSFKTLRPADMATLMSLVDLVVVPSVIETYSMVAREAQAVGTPVVFRKNLAPSTFADQNFLFPADDDTDVSLAKKALETVYLKRASTLSSRNPFTKLTGELTGRPPTHCFCYVIYGNQDIYRDPVFESARNFVGNQEIHFCIITPKNDYENLRNYFSALGNVSVFTGPDDFDADLPRLLRFLIPKYLDAYFYHFRDSDSLISEREIFYLSVLTALNFDLLIFRDHRLHFSPILAGLLTVKNSVTDRAFSKLSDWRPSSRYNYDQDFLVSKLYNDRKSQRIVATSCIRYTRENVIFLKPAESNFMGMPAFWRVNERESARHIIPLATLKKEVPLMLVERCSALYQRGGVIVLISWVSLTIYVVSRIFKRAYVFFGRN
jgi:glycosyltransferase involved in cell wall biosynthesis